MTVKHISQGVIDINNDVKKSGETHWDSARFCFMCMVFRTSLLTLTLFEKNFITH